MLGNLRPSLGVCYYPEQWPEEKWEDDFREMHDAGVRFVRIGEFAWSRLEPAPGDYQLDWLKRVLDLANANGLSIVLGTPSATPPKWLVEQMPEMLPIDAEGRQRKFGSRRHYCFSHSGYRNQCARIIQKLAEEFEVLNKRWGNAFWSLEYRDFDEVELPNLTSHRTESISSNRFSKIFFGPGQCFQPASGRNNSSLFSGAPDFAQFYGRVSRL